MATVDPRYKILSCRVSAAEYAEAEAASAARGFRSLSSFTRSAVLAVMEEAKLVSGADAADRDLPSRVKRLAAELKRLSDHLRHNGSSIPHNGSSVPEDSGVQSMEPNDV